MGTKGYYAIRYGGKLYLIYNQCDSHPDRLGLDLLNELKRISYEEWIEMFEKCVIIDSQEDYEEHFQDQYDLKVKILKHMEGGLYRFAKDKMDYEEVANKIDHNGFYGIYKYALSLERVLKSGYIFTDDSMYDVEYGYILDLDQKRFIYKNEHDHSIHDYSFYHLPKQLI
jgi:hypothetical protein